MSEHQTAMEAAIAASASKMTYGGAGVAGAGWAISNEAIAVLGLVIALAGLLINWHYKRRQDKREEREHQARMRGLE